MSKREIINHIQKFNTSAAGEFLSHFSDDDLLAYLHQLEELNQPIAETPPQREFMFAEPI